MKFSKSQIRHRSKFRYWRRIFNLLFLFFLLGLLALIILNLTKVKKVECRGLTGSQKDIIQSVIEANLDNYPLLLISRPQVEKIIQPLYLWRLESIKKQFPSTLIVDCRLATNKAYFYLTKAEFKPPRNLADWYSLNIQVWSKLDTKRPYLLVFDRSSQELNVIAEVLRVGSSWLTFSGYNIGQEEYQTAWNAFNWLEKFDPDNKGHYYVFVYKTSFLIRDKTAGLLYLFDRDNLPQPDEFRRFLSSLTLPKPRLLDWRGKNLVAW